MTSIPLPGKPVRGSRTGRPVMALLNFLGRRWVLRILWELREEPLGFRALQARCDNLSPTILSRRLNELRSMAIATQGEGGEYALTRAGKKLCNVILPLHFWAQDWAARLLNENQKTK